LNSVLLDSNCGIGTVHVWMCESFRRTVGNVSVHPEGFDRRHREFVECWCVFKVWSTFLFEVEVFGENGKSRVFFFHRARHRVTTEP